MSSETKYHCDFCNSEIVNKSVNENFQGWVTRLNRKGKQEASNHIENRLHGPHICTQCIKLIVKHKDFTSVGN